MHLSNQNNHKDVDLSDNMGDVLYNSVKTKIYKEITDKILEIARHKASVGDHASEATLLYVMRSINNELSK